MHMVRLQRHDVLPIQVVRLANDPLLILLSRAVESDNGSTIGSRTYVLYNMRVACEKDFSRTNEEFKFDVLPANCI